MDLFVKNFLSASNIVNNAIESAKKKDEDFLTDLDKFIDAALLEHPPALVNRIKKKPKADCSKNISRTSSSSIKPNSPSPTKGCRTKRNAASKAEKNLKEVSLHSKLRNDTTLVIKQEPINDVKIKREKLSLATNNEFKKPISPSKINDQSVMILPPTSISSTVEVSDDNDDDADENRMPPPPVPQLPTQQSTGTKPKKLNKKNKKKSKSGVPEPTKIKSERESDAQSITSAAVSTTEITEDNSSINNEMEEEHLIETEILAPVVATSNSTFVQVVPGTYKITENENNETFDIQPQIINVLTEIQPENDVQTHVTKKKNKNEIFNPCIQSPVIKKVQAFEQHAQKMKNSLSTAAEVSVASGSQRQTRTKTRAKVAAAVALAENDETKISDKTYSTTKNILTSPKPLQPSQLPTKTFTTPVASSSSSLSSLKSSNGPKEQQPRSVSRSASREHSAEDVKRGLQLIADEKKRKREEKLKHVQQQREANEKEKMERFKKQQTEKEEKQRQELEKRRLAKEAKEQEAENRRQQRILALQEKENQKKEQMAFEAAEAEERKRQRNAEELKILAEKNSVQKKLNENCAIKNEKFTWDMLKTDDETDDENDHMTENKAKRPPMPNWCLPGQREERIASQTHLNTAIVDAFFSASPMTVDLKEIFPDIAQKNLNRNSSAVWNTPPRYSSIDFPRY